MGHGIALVSAQAGYQVIAVEAKPDALEMGKKRINSSLNRILSKVSQVGKQEAICSYGLIGMIVISMMDRFAGM